MRRFTVIACLASTFAWGGSSLAFAGDQTPAEAEPQKVAKPAPPTMDLSGEAVPPGDTVDMPLSVRESPDGVLRDDNGLEWTLDKATTMRAKTPASPNATMGIESSPAVDAGDPTKPKADYPTTLPPHDAGADDKRFSAWRDKLVAAIQTKDWTKVEPFFAKDVHWSYGEAPSVGGFKGRWKPEVATSTIWGEMLKVFENGGTFGKTDSGETFFEAPYWSSWWPAAYDPVEWALLRGTKMALLEQPKDGATVLTSLDWSMVKREQPTEPVPPRGWAQVVTPEGKRGFVKDETLETPFGYRAICHQRGNQWYVTAFLSGE